MHSSGQCLGMLLMRWQMVSWGISSQTWIRASVSSWAVCGATWWHQMHQYIMSQRFSIGFRSGEPEPVSGINTFIFQELPTHSGQLRLGIVLHQEQPRAHYASSSYSHKGADTGPAAGLMFFYGPVQLSSCNGPSPGISSMVLRLCWETQQNFL